MMDTVKSFLRGVMDIALVVIPLSVVLGIISIAIIIWLYLRR